MKEETKLNKIDYAILKTIEQHPNWNSEDILHGLVFSNEPIMHITSNGDAREKIATLTKGDIIGEIAKQALRVAAIGIQAGKLSGKQDCIKFLNIINQEKISGNKITEFLCDNPELLEELITSFSKIRYRDRQEVDLQKLDKYINSKIREYIYYLNDNQGILAKGKVRSLTVFERKLNKSRTDIIKGVQLKKKSLNYSLGKDMFASINIGNGRNYQQDSVLLLRHPKNRDFKMLMVADGVGGHLNGGEASRYATQKIMEWFESLSVNYYEDIDTLAQLLSRKLKQISEELSTFNDGRATTFVGAILGNSQTVIASVGDSRAYIVKNNMLKQISRDDSLVQRYLDKGYIESKDDARFHISANQITQGLGVEDDFRTVKPHLYFLNNDDYDTVLLMSDGVSDCLSDTQIMKVSIKTPREKIARALVSKVLKTESHRQYTYKKNEFNDVIPAGHDNTTAAVLSKVLK